MGDMPWREYGKEEHHGLRVAYRPANQNTNPATGTHAEEEDYKMMPTCRTYCTMELRMARAATKKEHPMIMHQIKGYYNDGPSMGTSPSKKYWWTKDSQGRVLWEGYACCGYRARINAIDRLVRLAEDGAL